MMGNDEPMVYSYTEPSTRRLQVHQRADNLLKYFGSQLSRISEVFEFKLRSQYYPDVDYPLWKRYAEMLAWSESMEIEDLEYLLSFLVTEARLEKLRGAIGDCNVRLTMNGHSYLEELNYQGADST